MNNMYDLFTEHLHATPTYVCFSAIIAQLFISSNKSQTDDNFDLPYLQNHLYILFKTNNQVLPWYHKVHNVLLKQPDYIGQP